MAITCSQCDLFGICQSLGLNTPNNDGLKFSSVSQVELGAGKTLYNQSDTQHRVYAVREGILSAFDAQNNQLKDLFFPGELIGLESTSGGSYINSISASNSNCNLCLLDLDEIAIEELSFQKALSSALQKKMVQQQNSIINCLHTAEQRFSAFMLDILKRRKQHGFVENQFYLPISQNDLASYLGLAVATLSRVMKKFRTMGVIDINKRNYTIHNVLHLESVVNV